MAFCPKCGVEVSEDDNFCEDCGAKLRRKKTNAVIETDTRTEIEDEPKVKIKDNERIESEVEIKEYGRYGPSAFPKHILTEGEMPLFETRPLLWIRLLGPVVLLIFILAILIIAYVGFDATWILYVIAAAVLLGISWIFVMWVRWKYIVYAATNRRVLCQTGIISKSYVDCPLGKVQTVYLEVPIFGRMNDFGTVRVATAGEARVEIEWRNVKDPMKTQRILNEIIDKYGREQYSY